MWSFLNRFKCRTREANELSRQLTDKREAVENSAKRLIRDLDDVDKAQTVTRYPLPLYAGLRRLQ